MYLADGHNDIEGVVDVQMVDLRLMSVDEVNQFLVEQGVFRKELPGADPVVLGPQNHILVSFIIYEYSCEKAMQVIG